MKSYLRAVSAHLGRLSRADRVLALEALAAQLDELHAAGIDPVDALGAPREYAAELLEALSGDASAEVPRLRVLGVPVETRGPSSAEVRSRTWNPESPRLVVPRLLGAGWTLNLGALAVKLRLIRPDDATSDVLDEVPEHAVRAAQLVPLVVAGSTTAAVARVWRGLPEQVAAGFDLLGRPKRMGSKRSLVVAVSLGVVPALWAAPKGASAEDRLVRAASATTLATVSAAVVAASVLDARRPRGRWGLLVPAALPVGVAASLAVIVLPLRAGLRRVWRTADAAAPTGEAGAGRDR